MNVYIDVYRKTDRSIGNTWGKSYGDKGTNTTDSIIDDAQEVVTGKHTLLNLENKRVEE